VAHVKECRLVSVAAIGHTLLHLGGRSAWQHCRRAQPGHLQEISAEFAHASLAV
jgi:hypothetical protein